MADMLVKLYELPALAPLLKQQQDRHITIRRALAPEKHLVLRWIEQHFSAYWVSECDIAFSRQPVSCFIAISDAAPAGDNLLGFACYDSTQRNFFGPTGVSEAARGKGSGKALLLACLHDMRSQGYAYAIIGGVGPVDFYKKAVSATVIPGSEPGTYAGLLRDKPQQKDA